jgi:hypothetical protein
MNRRHTKLGVAVAATAVVGVLIAANARGGPPEPPATPVPGTVNEVPFDHTIHAGQYGIPCLDCHVYADKSPVAGLPSGRKCMGCHKFVAKEAPVVQKLAERVAAGQSLTWLRVFAVPDFIYFSHRMHVRAKVSCAECHGDMAAHKAITQDRPFTMGRCVACHEERHATRECLSCHK